MNYKPSSTITKILISLVSLSVIGCSSESLFSKKSLPKQGTIMATVEETSEGLNRKTTIEVYTPTYPMTASSAHVATGGVLQVVLSPAQEQSSIDKVFADGEIGIQEAKEDGKNRRWLLMVGSIGFILGMIMLGLDNKIISNAVALSVIAGSGGVAACGIAFKSLENMLGTLIWVAGIVILIGIFYIAYRYVAKWKDRRPVYLGMD